MITKFQFVFKLPLAEANGTRVDIYPGFSPINPEGLKSLTVEESLLPSVKTDGN